MESTASARDGRVALVTGASRGIGLAIARRLTADGFIVWLTARRREALDEAVAALGGSSVALAVAGKADDPAHQEEAVARTIETFGSLDLLVNNAGINPAYGPLVDLDLAAARKIVDVNVVGTLAWTQQAHRAWMGEHGGSVVNVASVAGLRPAGRACRVSRVGPGTSVEERAGPGTRSARPPRQGERAQGAAPGAHARAGAAHEALRPSVIGRLSAPRPGRSSARCAP